jgi:hypothetical protein
MSETTTTTEQTTTTQPEVLKMTQAELDALVAGRVGQAVAQTEKKYKGQPIAPEIQKELDDARAFKAELERKELERKGEYDKALAAQAKALEEKWKPELAARDEKIQKREARLHTEVVLNRIVTAAADGNAIAPTQVAALLKSYVKLNDDFEPQVVDDTGNPRFAPDGKPLTPTQLVEEFLRANPHFVKASGGKQGGAQGGATTKGAADVGVIAEKEKEVAALEEEARRNTGNLGLLVKHSRAVKELAELKSKSA